MSSLVFFLDVDNTLLDNDKLKADLDRRIRTILGPALADAFWTTYERLRGLRQVVDFPATLASFAADHPTIPNDILYATVMTTPFRSYLYPGVDRALSYLKSIGTPVILSDGDEVFQKRKIEESGLADAVEGRVIITIHKQAEMKTAMLRFPADHYVLVDDKPEILAHVEDYCAARVTTVLVRQGRYAQQAALPLPDIVLQHIADITSVPRVEFTLQ